MDTFVLTPAETLVLCFGDWKKVAEVLGLARAQVPQRWTSIPSKHIPALIEASVNQGRFSLDANMLTLPSQCVVGFDPALLTEDKDAA